jgi:hypothetical protein
VLPPDLHLKKTFLRRLFTRPRLLMRLGRSSDVNADVQAGTDCQRLPPGWFDYSNDNDVNNYVAEFDDGVPEDDDDDDGEFSQSIYCVFCC